MQESILIAEGDAPVRESAARLLSEAGYLVETAASGQAALEAARRSCFNLLAADVQLPDFDGIQVLQQMRALDPELAGIALTDHSSWPLARKVMRAGFAALLVKPFADDELLSAVAAALAQDRLRREYARLRALVPLYELSRAFSGQTDLRQLLDQIVRTAREETRADVVSLMLVEEGGRELAIAAASGLDPEVAASHKRALGTGIAGWVAAHGEPLIIAEGLPLDEAVRQAMGKPEVLSALCLPLNARREVIGVLNLARLRGAEPFTRSDLELATVLAGEAASAIDKARLIEDMRMLNETSQRLASALDLDEAASIIVEAASRFTQARRVALWFKEQASGQLLLYKEFDAAGGRPRRRTPPNPELLSPPEHFSPRDGVGLLWLPIARGDNQFGLLELELVSAQPLTSDRLGLIRTLAHTAAAVVESHRLRAREAIAFRELDSTLRSDLDLYHVLERVLGQMIEACGAQGGTIFLASQGGDHLDAWVSSGVAAPGDLAARLTREKRPLLISSLEVVGAAPHSLIGAPMMIGSRVEGAVVLTHEQPAAFAPSHLNLLSILTGSAALIVRNVELYARSEEAAISEERTRIARDIHDGLAQDLSFLLLKTEFMRQLLRKEQPELLHKEMEEMAAALRNDVREVRHTIFALRPLDLEARGFLPALEKFVNDFGTVNEIPVHLEVRGDCSNLPPKVQTALFRLAQESLNNVRKHAHASIVWVSLEASEEWVTLRVRDDGRGFNPAALPDARARGSVGMVQMRERAERAGGSFQVDSAPGQGTQIQVQLPARAP